MSTSGRQSTGRRRWARLRRRLLAWEFTPARIALLYLVLGFAALFVSDVLLVGLLAEPLLSRVQTLKGGIEVLATAGLILVLTRRSRAQLRRSNRTLERQREELDVLHRVLRHNLRNALTVIAGRAETLQKSARIEGEDRRLCAEIEASALGVVDLVEKASRIRRVTDRARPVTVDLTATVSSILEDHPSVPAGVDLRTDLPGTAPAAVNHIFEGALRELVENAVAHNPSEHPRVAIGVDTSPADTVDVTVVDDGPGVDDRVKAVFERGELDQLLHLDGMGLWFVYWTVTDGGGEFAIEDNEWGGTTVRLRLPKPGAEPIDLPAQSTVATA